MAQHAVATDSHGMTRRKVILVQHHALSSSHRYVACACANRTPVSIFHWPTPVFDETVLVFPVDVPLLLVAVACDAVDWQGGVDVWLEVSTSRTILKNMGTANRGAHGR